MIDLNKIRSLTTLEEMKKDLADFLVNPEVIVIYKEENDGRTIEYEDDKELVLAALAKVEHRIQSLGKYLKREAEKQK